jgi:diguanylate cyclase (GGDEF)-like protein
MRLYRNLAKILSQRIAEFTDEKDSPHDELTGALTKPFLCELLSQEVKRSRHFSESISLMLLDIDIKPLHDELASDFNDAVVMDTTKLIHQIIQPTDVLARWEKCSFIMLLPKTTSSAAIKLAEKIKITIENAEITRQAKIEINAAVTEVLPADKSQDAIARLEKSLLESRENRKSFRITVA